MNTQKGMDQRTLAFPPTWGPSKEISGMVMAFWIAHDPTKGRKDFPKELTGGQQMENLINCPLIPYKYIVPTFYMYYVP